mmetsp:Transcript_4535/g.6784  ORF Transcript_4535/g.6784 Transcript_4535/m.6784 type:complete len:453 (-) Transcript_4535:448-1806(-)
MASAKADQVGEALLKNLDDTVTKITSEEEIDTDSKQRILCGKLLLDIEKIILYGLKGKDAKHGNIWPFIQSIRQNTKDFFFFVSDIDFLKTLYFEKEDKVGRGRAWIRHLLNASRLYISIKLMATLKLDSWYIETKSIFNNFGHLERFIDIIYPLQMVRFQLVLQEPVIYELTLKNETSTSIAPPAPKSLPPAPPSRPAPVPKSSETKSKKPEAESESSTSKIQQTERKKLGTVPEIKPSNHENNHKSPVNSDAKSSRNATAASTPKNDLFSPAEDKDVEKNSESKTTPRRIFSPHRTNRASPRTRIILLPAPSRRSSSKSQTFKRSPRVPSGRRYSSSLTRPESNSPRGPMGTRSRVAPSVDTVATISSVAGAMFSAGDGHILDSDFEHQLIDDFDAAEKSREELQDQISETWETLRTRKRSVCSIRVINSLQQYEDLLCLLIPFKFLSFH